MRHQGKNKRKLKKVLKFLLIALVVTAAVLLICNMAFPLIGTAICWFCENIIAPAIVIVSIIVAICVWAS